MPVPARILMIVEEVYEDLELWYPLLRLREAGYQVVVAAPVAGRVYGGKHGYPCTSDCAISTVNEDDFVGLVIPGGFAPDRLRRSQEVLALVRAFHDHGKLIGHICHAGWVPISAKIMRGYRCTSTPAIRDDLENAGAIWEDAPVVIDRHMVSSRRPDDLPDFCRGLLQVLRQTPNGN
jgi:protease I